MSVFDEIENYLGPYKISIAGILAEDESSTFPTEAQTLIDQLNILENFIPDTFMGKMGSVEDTLQMGRAISRRNLTSAIAIGQTLLGSLPVWIGGNEEQKKDLAKNLRAGWLNCLALTEEEHGSDLSSSEVAVSDTGLIGKKWCINNATRGRQLSVLAKNKNNDLLNVHFLQKDKKYEGDFSNIPKIKTHGIRGADISGIIFKDFKQENSLLGKDGHGLEIVFKTLQISRLLCGSFTLGAVDTVLRRTLEFSETRILYGKSILEIPTVRSKIVDAYKKLLLIEAYALSASRFVTFIPEQMSVYSAISKFLVSEMGDEIIHPCTEILGARYYIRENEIGIVQKMERDHRVVSLFDGSSAVNLSVIMGQLKRLASQDQTGEISPDPSIVFNLKHKAPKFSGDEKLRLTNRGNDYIWKCIFSFTFSGKADFEAELEKLKQEKLKLNSDVLNLSDDQVQSHEMAALARAYSELTMKANYLLFWYFNHSSFAPEMGSETFLGRVLGEEELDLNVPLKQLHDSKLFSHLDQKIND